MKTSFLLFCVGLAGCAQTAVPETESPASQHQQQPAQISAPTDIETTSQTDNVAIVQKNACDLVHTQTLYDKPFVLSSLQSFTMHGNRRVVVFETEPGDAYALIITDDNQIVSQNTLAANAQIACAETTSDGFRVGLILRDPKTASYTLEVQSFDKSGKAIETWKAVTRGFVPDPGTHCAFLEHRKLLVNGTRPRGERPPYHGLFVLESAALTQIDSTQNSEAELISAAKQSDQTFVLTREIRRDSNPPAWIHVLYQLNADNTFSEISSGDYLLPDHTVVAHNGCIDAHPELCLNDIKLTDVKSLNSKTIEYIYRNGISLANISNDVYKFVYTSKENIIYPYDDTNWIAAKRDTSRPDIGVSMDLSHLECDGDR